MKDKFLICCIENEIDLAFDKWLKWSRVKLVHRAVKLCSLSLRARICNNTLNGSYTELWSRCKQTLVGIFFSNLEYKWSILTSLRISETIEGTSWRVQPTKWQSTARKQPRWKVKPTCRAQHFRWHCTWWLSQRQKQTDLRVISLEKNPGHSDRGWLSYRWG